MLWECKACNVVTCSLCTGVRETCFCSPEGPYIEVDQRITDMQASDPNSEDSGYIEETPHEPLEIVG